MDEKPVQLAAGQKRKGKTNNSVCQKYTTVRVLWS